MIPGDLLARWMAETGKGSIDSFKKRFHWLAGSGRVQESEPGRWLRDVSALGHVEVDWTRQRWWAAPLALTRVPGCDGLAMLCGLRTLRLDTVLDRADLAVETILQDAPAGSLSRPAAKFIQYGPSDDLRSIAETLGARHVPCAALQLSSILPVLSVGQETASPAHDNQTLEHFDTTAFLWEQAEDRLIGAYRYRAAGRHEFRWFEHGRWYRADWPTCVFLSLRRGGISALRWREEGTGARTGKLFVDWGAALPVLHQRAAVLCSGLTPRFTSAARTGVYDNVPRTVAERIAQSLFQKLGMHNA